MTLWQVLVSEQPLDPLLDKLPSMTDTELAALSQEALNVLMQVAGGGIGTLSPSRVWAWVESARVLALASLPGMGPGRRTAEHNVEVYAARARGQIEGAERVAAARAQRAREEQEAEELAPRRLVPVQGKETVTIGGKTYIRVARGAGAVRP